MAAVGYSSTLSWRWVTISEVKARERLDDKSSYREVHDVERTASPQLVG